MVKGGVFVTLMLMGCSPVFSITQPHEPSTSDSLFTDIDTNRSNPPLFKALDLDEFLEDSPELEKEFRTLSQDDKDALLEVLDLINEAFSRALYEVMNSDQGHQEEQETCGCLALLAQLP